MALPPSSASLPILQLLTKTSPLSTLSRFHLHTATQSWPLSGILSASISLPAISLKLPGLISDIWEGILKAVPKKKTSHMKKRHRQLAGKALKDVNAVNTCPGCGKPKKAHFLCPYCVAEIKESWKQAAKEALK